MNPDTVGGQLGVLRKEFGLRSASARFDYEKEIDGKFTVKEKENEIDITEQEYREQGYIPTFDKLPMLIVRRLPVRIPVPSEQDR